MLHLVFKVSSTCSHTRLKSLSPLSSCFINYALVKLVPFLSNPASLIPALKWMVSIIETYCLREIFCPILSSTRITSHFSRTEPQRIGLANLLSNSYLWNMQLQTTSPESKFPNEYSDVIFIQIDQHLKKLLQKYKGVPILWITVYSFCLWQINVNIG